MNNSKTETILHLYKFYKPEDARKYAIVRNVTMNNCKVITFLFVNSSCVFSHFC